MPKPTSKGSIDASCATTGYHFDRFNHLDKTQDSKDDLWWVHKSAYKDARSTLKEATTTENITQNVTSRKSRTGQVLNDMLDGTSMMLWSASYDAERTH